MSKILNERTERVSVDKLLEHPANPRSGDVAAIVESITTNGFYGAIVAQRSTGHVLAGNHRLKAAREVGLTKVPVVWVDVDDDRALRILLADNRTNDLAGYDDAALEELLKELAGTELGFAGTGYDGDYLASLLADDVEGIEEDPVPDPPIDPTTKLGDVWELGEHRLICGDATTLETLTALLAGEAVDALLTDPPYNVDYQGGTSDALKIQNDNMTAPAFLAFLTDALTAAASTMRKGAPAYVFHADTEGLAFRQAFAASGIELKQVLVWAKNTFVLGRQDYQWQHEPILYGWKPGAAHSWYGAFDKTTVIDDLSDRPLDKMTKAELLALFTSALEYSTVIKENKPARNGDHPTMKPVKLCARLVANSTKAGQIILDPFAGSGSTLMACEHLNRKARVIELDPRYCDVIVQRWEAATGQKAVRG